MFSIKLSFNNEFRRMAVPAVSGKPNISMDELISITRRGYNGIGNKEFAFLWTDEDGDIITVSSNEELQFAFACMLAQSANVFKFSVDVSKSNVQDSTFSHQAQPAIRKSPVGNSTNQSNLAIHANVSCDECGVSPIVGVRYKCAVRNDFDLCEQCEGRSAQPYPMIKIYDPEQAPIAILIAVRDHDEDPRRGRSRHGPPHGHGGIPHHPHHPHHARGRPWGGQGPHGKPDGKPDGPAATNGVHGPPHCGWKKWDRAGCPMKSKNAFFNALEEFVNPSSVDSKPKNEEMQALEQTLLDEAVRASLEEQSFVECSAPLAPSPASDSSVLSAASADSLKSGSVVSHGTESRTSEKAVEDVRVAATVIPAPLANSSMRVVQDVTFRDGSKVQAGTVFSKIWRVLNDGDSMWPEGIVLVTTGGDLLTTADLKAPVARAHPGEEVEVSVTLTAPRRAGRHTAYFRLQNADGISFGQRLWADIVVEDEDPTWAVVSSMTLDSTIKALGSSNNSVSGAVLSESAVSETVSETGSVKSGKASSEVATTVAAAQAAVTGPQNSAADVAANVWSRVWAAELEVLSQMGFVDVKALIPLLQEHVSVPVSLAAPGAKGVPNAEGMQRVVMHLLGQSI